MTKPGELVLSSKTTGSTHKDVNCSCGAALSVSYYNLFKYNCRMISCYSCRDKTYVAYVEKFKAAPLEVAEEGYIIFVLKS